MAEREIEFTKSAEKELADIPEGFQAQIIPRIAALASNPFPNGCKKLAASDSYRIRSGTYRIIYAVFDKRVVILAIGHRKDIYR